VLVECPFDPEHKAPDAAVFSGPNGKLGFKCLHESCSQFHWREFRQHFEPGCYDRSSNGQKQQSAPPRNDSQEQPDEQRIGRPRTINLAEVESVPIQWLWPNRIALGKLNLLLGDPGLGKGFVTADITARITNGGPFPDEPPGTRNPPGSVIIVKGEDALNDTVKPRL